MQRQTFLGLWETLCSRGCVQNRESVFTRHDEENFSKRILDLQMLGTYNTDVVMHQAFDSKDVVLPCAARAHEVETAPQYGSAPSRIPAATSVYDSYERASDYDASSHVHSSLSSVSEAWAEHHTGPPLSQLLHAFSGAGSDWKVSNTAE